MNKGVFRVKMNPTIEGHTPMQSFFDGETLPCL
jgi:hypothetical protein